MHLVSTYIKFILLNCKVLGFMGFVFMLLMAFFAFEPIRRYNYELFLALHFLSPLVILFIMLHAPVLQLGFIPGILLHGVNL